MLTYSSILRKKTFFGGGVIKMGKNADKKSKNALGRRPPSHEISQIASLKEQRSDA